MHALAWHNTSLITVVLFSPAACAKGQNVVPGRIGDDREINLSDFLLPVQINDTPSGPLECELNHEACLSSRRPRYNLRV